jgi:hypothetical protein
MYATSGVGVAFFTCCNYTHSCNAFQFAFNNSFSAILSKYSDIQYHFCVNYNITFAFTKILFFCAGFYHYCLKILLEIIHVFIIYSLIVTLNSPMIIISLCELLLFAPFIPYYYPTSWLSHLLLLCFAKFAITLH